MQNSRSSMDLHHMNRLWLGSEYFRHKYFQYSNQQNEPIKSKKSWDKMLTTLKFPHTTSLAHAPAMNIQNRPLYRVQAVYSLRRSMFTNKMIRIHDCVTWNAFSNLWNCINSLDFCHQYSLPNVPCSILFYHTYIKVPKQVQNFWTIFFFCSGILIFFTLKWERKGEIQKGNKNQSRKNGLMNLKLARFDIDLFENENHFRVEIKMKSFAKSRWKIWIRNTPVGYVCSLHK